VAVPIDFPTSALPATPATKSDPDRPTLSRAAMPPNLQTLADRVLVSRFAPVGILCNDKGDVLYISGRTGKYLEPAVGKANMNVFAMAREGLRYELSHAFSTAMRQEKPVMVRGLRVANNGGTELVDLTVQRLTEPKQLLGTVIVIIADAPVKPEPPRPKKPHGGHEPHRVQALEQELQSARDDVQTAREEMQTSQEELKSTNEELQSTNEELQSSNEELTTSKEEMQSLNEELQTVNHELQAKVDELSRANNDMKNLLNSTDIATLFLDGQLNVRRFTTPTTKIIKLIAGDAGRPITDIASDLMYADLADDAHEVLRTLIFKEKQVTTRDGRWFVVRIMPYRTLENLIDGLVLTFTDASASKALEGVIKEQASQLRQMIEALPELVMSAGPNGSCDYIGGGWLEMTGASESELLGYGWFDQVHLDEREHVRDAWRAGLKAAETFDLDMRLRQSGGAYRWFRTRVFPIRDAQGTIARWYGIAVDIDNSKRADQGRAQAQLAALLEHVGEGVLTLDGELTITFVNRAAARVLDHEQRTAVGKRLGDAFPAAKGALEPRLVDAVRKGETQTFETRLDSAGLYTVRVYPQRDPDGLAVLIERGNGT
jgi:two-component system CheB/CheR fusion protein